MGDIPNLAKLMTAGPLYVGRLNAMANGPSGNGVIEGFVTVADTASGGGSSNLKVQIQSGQAMINGHRAIFESNDEIDFTGDRDATNERRAIIFLDCKAHGRNTNAHASNMIDVNFNFSDMGVVTGTDIIWNLTQNESATITAISTTTRTNDTLTATTTSGWAVGDVYSIQRIGRVIGTAATNPLEPELNEYQIPLAIVKVPTTATASLGSSRVMDSRSIYRGLIPIKTQNYHAESAPITHTPLDLLDGTGDIDDLFVPVKGRDYWVVGHAEIAYDDDDDSGQVSMTITDADGKTFAVYAYDSSLFPANAYSRGSFWFLRPDVVSGTPDTHELGLTYVGTATPNLQQVDIYITFLWV